MHRLRYSALAILVALGVIACGGAADEGETETPHVTGQEIADLLDDPDVFLLDVRNPDELPEQGAIEGYTLIPIGELADRLDEVPRDKKILTI
jgi:predicted sulfurtransferase